MKINRASEIDALSSSNKSELHKLVEAVANIGIDFSYGKFDITEEHIEVARNLIRDMESSR